MLLSATRENLQESGLCSSTTKSSTSCRELEQNIEPPPYSTNNMADLENPPTSAAQPSTGDETIPLLCNPTFPCYNYTVTTREWVGNRMVTTKTCKSLQRGSLCEQNAFVLLAMSSIVATVIIVVAVVFILMWTGKV
jgi:hypothetical protein